MSTPVQDLTVGASIAVEVLEQIHHAADKMPDHASRVRLWLGVFCGLAGAARQSLGPEDAVLVLKASINAVSKEIPE